MAKGGRSVEAQISIQLRQWVGEAGLGGSGTWALQSHGPGSNPRSTWELGSLQHVS